MSTETADYSLEDFLKDPLSAPDGVDIESLAANQQGETDGDAPGTKPEDKQDEPNGERADAPTDKPSDKSVGQEPEANSGDAPSDASSTPEPEESPAGVASRDGKHIIPYGELRSARERAARAEIMAQELTAKLEALQNEISTGRASKTRAIADIVDDETLNGLREDAPEVASVIDKLIERNQELSERIQTTGQHEDIESRVQAVVSVEDAINAIPKLSHVRASDPATFMAIAEIDTVLGKQDRWKDQPLVDRFQAAVRMYEAANGDIEAPGNVRRLPVDTDARVEKAVAKAQAQTSGPSTLSDIPGGEPAANTREDALTSLSSTALTERFMQMTPEQIETELARLL